MECYRRQHYATLFRCFCFYACRRTPPPLRFIGDCLYALHYLLIDAAMPSLFATDDTPRLFHAAASRYCRFALIAVIDYYAMPLLSLLPFYGDDCYALIAIYFRYFAITMMLAAYAAIRHISFDTLSIFFSPADFRLRRYTLFSRHTTIICRAHAAAYASVAAAPRCRRCFRHMLSSCHDADTLRFR